MNKKTVSGVWYGELRSKRGSTIVIRDDELPAAAQGRIYLYNTEREAMVLYDEAIVSDKLFELDAEQQKTFEKQFKSGWEEAKKQLCKVNGKPASKLEEVEKIKPVDDLLIEEESDGFDDD